MILEAENGDLLITQRLGPEMRRLCRKAALLYDSGSRKAGRKIFKWVLNRQLPYRLRIKLCFMSTYRIAMLAHHLAFPEKISYSCYSNEDLKTAVKRLRKIRKI